MPALPPPLPTPGNLRLASALNLLLPGAGIYYLGKRALGVTLASAFISCFLAVFGVFLVGYVRYLSIATEGNLMEGDRLEEAAAAFHPNWLATIAGAGLVIHLISSAIFMHCKRKLNHRP